MANPSEALIKHVEHCVEQANLGKSKLNDAVLQLSGMSSAKVRHFLNNLCTFQPTHYFEIGIWKGSTFISAMFNNTVESATAIDNFFEFGGPRIECLDNLQTFLSSHKNWTFHEVDCWQFDRNKISQPINIFFYDGNHDVSSQKNAFVYFNDIFADTFIAVVDDWNGPTVREGTKQAFDELKYQILFEIELASRGNGDLEQWWNGLYCAVISKR